MSWSENRSKDEKKPSLESRRNSLRQVNLVLEKLSKDEDLHDDLKLPEVKRAIQHWTGQNRLPAEEAVKLTDHRRVVYVLQRLQMLQSVSKEALIGVPFDQFISGATRVPDDLAIKLFGEDIIDGAAAKPTLETQPLAKQTAAKPVVLKPAIKVEASRPVSEPVAKPQQEPSVGTKMAPTTSTSSSFGPALFIAFISILIAAFAYSQSR